MADALAELGYAMGAEVNNALNSSLASVSAKLDTLLSSVSSSTQSTARVTLPSATTVARIAAIASRKQGQGMNAQTGRLLTGVDHLKQSIANILHTRIASRVMRRTFGSNLFERIDQPQNDLTRVGVIADIAAAIDQWEPRFSLRQVKLTGTTEEQNNGKLFCTLIGPYKGAEISVKVVV